MINFKSKTGVSLYYAVLMMSITLAIALGVNTIAIKSLITTREVKKSPPAFHAADTGIEKALYEISQGQGSIGDNYPGDLDNGAHYDANIVSPTTTPEAVCPSDSMYCIYSTGSYGGSQRRVKVVR